ncbi:MAG TPA: 5'-3' exonuclease H3TH domain-containing protein [Solirubrobacteraceae bacterium]|jgi:5'-3' exonuclease|nr:5'-3' exonuclease H3TH domain-containing protein [Solirubrobacteraceae bacterium]
MPEPLLIADVPWLLYRSYFALPKSIAGADGRPVNALLGVVNALLAALEARPSRAVLACFGAEQARYRVEAFPPYHAHRDPMPADLAEQWARAPALLASFAWSVIDAEELEADDAMGSYAQAEERAGGRALLLTADRDLYQAVSERVAVLEMGKGGVFAELGPEQVLERYSIAPAQVPDFIALRGDPSDGLPGAPGIGAKTAATLLRRYGTLEALLEEAERQCAETVIGAPKGTSELRPRVAAALHENAELLRTFKHVATLVEIEAPRPPDRATDFATGAEVARKIGMKRLAERLEGLASSGG